MNDNYRFQLLTLSADELERTSALLRLVFPKARHLTPRYLRWHHVDNPDGHAVGCNAFLGDALVGHMAATPLVAQMDSASVRGLFMTNGAVHPAHRGRKLQSRISHAMFEEMASLGYSFVMGTGNRYSTGPLLTRFRLLGPLDARIGYGTPRRLDAGVRPSFERIWSTAALDWRLSNPETDYRVDAAGGNLRITAPSGAPGVGAILYAGADAWNLPSQGEKLHGHGPLKVWIGLDPGVDWARSTFVRIPPRLRPSPLNLVFRDLSGGALLPDAARMIFRAIDFDPY